MFQRNEGVAYARKAGVEGETVNATAERANVRAYKKVQCGMCVWQRRSACAKRNVTARAVGVQAEP